MAKKAKAKAKPAAKKPAPKAKAPARPKGVQPVPEGFTTVTPHLVVRDAAAALDFYKKAFGAVERFRMPMGGKIGHAEFQIGGSIVMLADEFEGMSSAPQGSSPVNIHLYVPDADAVFRRATSAGASVKMPMTDMFWGDRYGAVTDPFGHCWSIATHVKDLSPEEIGRAAEAAMSQHAGQA